MRCYRHQAELRDKGGLTAEATPRLLWPKGKVNEDDLEEGFTRNVYLVRVRDNFHLKELLMLLLTMNNRS